MEKRLFLVASAVEDGRPRWWTQAGWVRDFSDAALVPESRRDQLKEAEERALAEGRLLNPEILRVARQGSSPDIEVGPEVNLGVKTGSKAETEVSTWTGVELRARARLAGPTVGPAQLSRETREEPARRTLPLRPKTIREHPGLPSNVSFVSFEKGSKVSNLD